MRGDDSSFLDWKEEIIGENKRVLRASIRLCSMFLSSVDIETLGGVCVCMYERKREREREGGRERVCVRSLWICSNL